VWMLTVMFQRKILVCSLAKGHLIVIVNIRYEPRYYGLKCIIFLISISLNESVLMIKL